METSVIFGARADRKETTSNLAKQLPVFDKEPPPFPGKSLQYTLSQPSLGEEVFEGCFGAFPEFFSSDLLHTEGRIPPSLSPQEDLAFDWFSEVEGGFILSSPYFSQEDPRRGLKYHGSKLSLEVDLGQRSAESFSSHLPGAQEDFVKSTTTNVFISAFLDIEEHHGFVWTKKIGGFS